MSSRCERCGKGVQYGHNVSHAKNRTRRIFKPNLHTLRVVVDGIRKKMTLCSSCVRMVRRESKMSKVNKGSEVTEVIKENKENEVNKERGIEAEVVI